MHWLETDQHCRNHLSMAKDPCMIDHLQRVQHPSIKRLRIEGVLYETGCLHQVTRIYQQALKKVMCRLNDRVVS